MARRVLEGHDGQGHGWDIGWGGSLQGHAALLAATELLLLLLLLLRVRGILIARLGPFPVREHE